jgi:hypothetical protein
MIETTNLNCSTLVSLISDNIERHLLEFMLVKGMLPRAIPGITNAW